MDSTGHHIQRDEAITLRDVLMAIRGHLQELMRSRMTLLLFIGLGVGYYMVQHWSHQVNYTASCTFMINDEEPSLGITGILGDFGLPGRQDFKLDKIAELARSRTMTAKVLLGGLENSDSNVTLANRFIQMLESEDDWVGNGWFGEENPLVGFRFEHGRTEEFDRRQNKALQMIHRALTSRLETNINEVTGILEFRLTGADESVTYEVLNGLFRELSEYYTDKRIEKQQSTFDALDHKCDSLQAVLNEKEYALASFRDKNRSQWLNVEQTPEDKLYREVRMISIMYGEALKNKEMAAFSLANVKPFIQVIDSPIYPLKKNQSVWWIKFIMGVIVGGIIGVAYVVLRKIIREAMAPETINE